MEVLRKVGQEFGKQFVMGVIKGGKDVVIKMVKVFMELIFKEVIRKVGQEVGKEFVKGVIIEVVEEVV